MITDAIAAQETFQAVDERLNPVLKRYLGSLGITPEDHAATVAEAFARMWHEAESFED